MTRLEGACPVFKIAGTAHSKAEWGNTSVATLSAAACGESGADAERCQTTTGRTFDARSLSGRKESGWMEDGHPAVQRVE